MGEEGAEGGRRDEREDGEAETDGEEEDFDCWKDWREASATVVDIGSGDVELYARTWGIEAEAETVVTTLDVSGIDGMACVTSCVVCVDGGAVSRIESTFVALSPSSVERCCENAVAWCRIADEVCRDFCCFSVIS